MQAWNDEAFNLKSAGFTDEEVAGERVRLMDEASAAGFTPEEVEAEYGKREPDMKPLKDMMQSNLDAAAAKRAEKKANSTSDTPEKEPEIADNIFEAIWAGYEGSSWKMASKALQGQKSIMPEMLLPEDADRFYRIGSQVGTLFGDFPAMVAGAVGSGIAATAAGFPALGPAATIPGIAAAGAGGNALPAAIRETLVNFYEKGEIKDFGDFWDRASATFIQTTKEAVIGGATAGIGGKVLGAASKVLAPAGAKTAAISTEIATMTMLGKGLEGEMPSANDFIDGAIMVGGLHGATAAAGKLRKTFAKTGQRPWEVAEEAANDITVKQDLLVKGDEIPDVYKALDETSKDSGKMKINGMEPEIKADDIEARLIEEAKGYASKEDFIRDHTFGVPVGMTPFGLHISENSVPSDTSVFHGTTAVKAILDSGQLTPMISKGDNLGEKVVSLTRYRDAANGFGFVFEVENGKAGTLRDVSKRVMGEQTREGLEVRSDAPIPLENIKTLWVELGSKEKLSDSFGVGKNRTTIQEIVDQAEAKGIKVKIIRKGDKLGEIYDAAKGKEKTDLDLAREKIAGQIQVAPDKPKEGFSLDKARYNWIDKFAPIEKVTKELGGKDLDVADNPYALSRMANDAPAKALHFFGDTKNPENGGVLDFKTLEKTGKSLGEITKSVKDDIGRLDSYLAAKRALTDYDSRGLESGFDLDAARKVVAADKGKLDKVQKEIVKFNNGVLKYAHDSGLIDAKKYNESIAKNENYVPFKRIQEDGAKGSGPSKKSVIKKLKGGTDAIQSPLQSVVENTQKIIEMAEKNRAVVKLVELAEKTEGQTIFTKVKEPKQAIRVSGDEINKGLDAQGIEVDSDAITIFRKQESKLLDNQFEVFREGKREVWEVADPLIAESLKQLDGNAVSQSTAMKIAKGLTNIKRLGITMTPDFIMKNISRDYMSANIFTKSDGINVIDVAHAMKDLWGRNENYYNWLKAGGANGAFIEMSKISDQYTQLGPDATLMDKTWNLIKTPKHMIEFMGTMAEQSLRLAEFKKVSASASSGDRVFRGGFASRDVTLDFQRMGAKMAALNSITAFANVQIQGLDKTRQAFADNPGKTAGQMAKTSGMRAAMLITTPSLLLWFANKDDERVREIPQWQKDRFWIFTTDDWQKETEPGEASGLPEHMIRMNEDGRIEINKGTIYRIPKPQELGMVFGSIPERIMDAFYKQDPEAFAGLGETLIDTVTPSFVPDIITPIAEQVTNYSFFTGNKVVPGHLEDLLPAYQHTNYTSDVAKGIGKMINVFPPLKETSAASPMIIDNYIKSWTGALGQYAVGIVDKGLQMTGVTPDPVKPAWTLEEYPIIKAFTIKYPSASSNSIKKFYEGYEENEKVMNTFKHIGKSGDIDGAIAFQEDPEMAERMWSLQGVKEGLSNQSAIIQGIMADKENYTPQEKQQLIEGAYYQMIEAAKMGNEMNKSFKESMKEGN